MLKKLVGDLRKLAGRPGFWLILSLLVLISIPYYEENIKHPAFLMSLIAKLGLARHSFERILFLGPIVWSGFLFGQRGATVTSILALLIMLPRALLVGDNPVEAVLETSAVFIVGNVMGITFELLSRERERRSQLENAQRELQISEQRYRELFENAHDAIWLHDLKGIIIAANRAAVRMTGYAAHELNGMNVREFMSEESLALAGEIRKKLLHNEPVDQPYEQRIRRKDGTEAIIQLSTSIVQSGSEPAAFQHIARDVTEQKQMQENLRFYLQQATKAQEEERKRISRELHDETIQSLVALSRQIDALASGSKDLPDELRRRLEELWQQTNNVMKDVRRLSQDLRPPALDRLGLVPALEFLASDVGRYSGIDIKLAVSGTERRLAEEAELVLFRITQEALRNVYKHASATRAGIAVGFESDRVRITVSDNGKGFSLPRNMGDLARTGKLGLAGMQERARLIGGDLSVDSHPGKGTTVTIQVGTG